jgi:hypothetical protein
MDAIKDVLIEFGAKTKPLPPKKTKVHEDLWGELCHTHTTFRTSMPIFDASL